MQSSQSSKHPDVLLMQNCNFVILKNVEREAFFHPVIFITVASLMASFQVHPYALHFDSHRDKTTPLTESYYTGQLCACSCLHMCVSVLGSFLLRL